MNIMEITSTPPRFRALARWLVPLAAIVVLGVWSYVTPPGLLAKADSIGYAICHRIDERSFHVAGHQLPLCARCTGEFYAAGLTLLFLSLVSQRRSGFPGWRVGAPLLFFFLAFGIDGSNSYLYLMKQIMGASAPNLPNLYTPNNTLRLLTGSGMGIALASIVYPAFNQSVWRNPIAEPALDWKKLGILIGGILLIDLLVLTDNPVIVASVAIISLLGVLALLVIVFSMSWIMMMKQENDFDSLLQLWLPSLAGTTFAFLLITVIDLLRFNLTGTWGAFPLG